MRRTAARGFGRTILRVGLVVILAGCSETARSSPASPDAAAAETPTCDVSPLLVPSCGAWFGASTPSTDGQYDYTRGLEEYESVVGITPDILHFYQRGAEPFPTAEHRALAQRPGRPRSLLFFNWKPAPEMTWRQVADGAAEPAIDAVAAGLSSYPHRLFLTIHHEPENDVIARDGSGMTVRDYVDMYRHVVAGLRARGVDNVVYVMNYMGFERWSSLVDELYPGDDVVDWIAYDPYAFGEHESFADMLDDPGDGWPGFYSWATEKAPGTPLMLGEWGVYRSPAREAASVLDGAAEILRTQFPEIRAIVYWSDLGERVDGRLALDDEETVRFARAFAQLAADPYFDAVSTDLAP